METNVTQTTSDSRGTSESETDKTGAAERNESIQPDENATDSTIVNSDEDDSGVSRREESQSVGE